MSEDVELKDWGIALEDFDPTGHKSVGVILGPPGSGKTTVVRRLVESGRNVLLIDTDGGSDDTLRDLAHDPAHAGRGRLKRIRVKTMHQFYGALWAAEQLPEDYVIVLDSATRLMFNYSRQLRWGSNTDIEKVPDTLTMQQHGKIGNRGEDLWYYFNQRNIGHHCIILCHEEFFQDEEGKMYRIAKMPGKKSYQTFPDKFDFILRAVRVVNHSGENWMISRDPNLAETKLRLPPEMLKEIPMEFPNEQFGQIYNEYLAPMRGRVEEESA